MPLKRETTRLLAQMTQSVDERAAITRAVREAHLNAKVESVKLIEASRKLLAETADIVKGYTPTKW